MIAQSLIGAPLLWLDWSPVLVYNLLVMLGLALSGFSMALLVRSWTGSTAAGIVAGCLFGFNAHVLTRFAHLQAHHVEFIPPALHALDRLLETPRWRYAFLVAGMFVAQALCSNYTMVFLAAGLLMAVLVRPDGWWTRARDWWPRALAAAALAILVLVPVLLPYYHARSMQGLSRSIDEVRLYSATWRDYLATGGRLHYELWSHRFFSFSGTALFPGITAIALTIVAVLSGRAWRDRRARMLLALGVLGFALSFGPSMFGYVWLHQHIPLLEGIRAAARWALLPLTAIAVLAGFGVQWLAERHWRPRAWMATACVLVSLVTLEALRAPMSFTPFASIPHAHDRLREEPWGPFVAFPLYPVGSVHANAAYMIDQTRHFRPMINGYSGYFPPTFTPRAERLQRFPSSEALDELRALGVTHVLVYRTAAERVYGKDVVSTLDGMSADLQFVIEEDGVRIYRLLRPSRAGLKTRLYGSAVQADSKRP